LLALARGHPRKPSFEDPFGTGKPADEKQEPRIEAPRCCRTPVLRHLRFGMVARLFFPHSRWLRSNIPNSNYVSSIWLFGVRLQH
jgi:hypothetical protein